MNIRWTKTPGLQKALETAVEQKLTASQIARHLSAKFGLDISREAVAARIRRSGLVLAARPGWPHPKAPTGASKPRKRKAPPIVEIAPTPRGDVPDGCRWMHGDHLRERNFCGAAAHNHSPWCGFHWPIVYDAGATAKSAAATKMRLAESNR